MNDASLCRFGLTKTIQWPNTRQFSFYSERHSSEGPKPASTLLQEDCYGICLNHTVKDYIQNTDQHHGINNRKIPPGLIPLPNCKIHHRTGMPPELIKQCLPWKSKRESKNRSNLQPLERPLHCSKSHVTQRNSPITPNTQKSRIEVIHTKTDLQNKTDKIGKSQVRFPPPIGRETSIVELDNNYTSMTSVSWNPNYRIKISIGILSNTLLTVSSLVNTDASSKWINQDLHLIFRK